MAFECRLLGVVRLSIFGRFVFLESAISGRFVWDFSEIWICGLYIKCCPAYSKQFCSNLPVAVSLPQSTYNPLFIFLIVTQGKADNRICFSYPKLQMLFRDNAFLRL